MKRYCIYTQSLVPILLDAQLELFSVNVTALITREAEGKGEKALGSQ